MLDAILRTSVVLGMLVTASPVHADEQAVLRVREDPRRDRLWVLRPNGVHLYGLKSRQLLRHIALPGWYWAGEPYSCAPDLAVGPHGEALVTSDVAPVLWRVDARSLAVSVRELALETDQHRDVGFTGLAYSPQQGAYLAVTHAGSLWRVDASLSTARKIALSAPLAQACGISVLPALCVRGEDKDWLIELAPDAHSGRVSPTPLCARPGEGAVAGNGRSTAR